MFRAAFRLSNSELVWILEMAVPFMNLWKTKYLGGMIFDQDIGVSAFV